MKPTWNQKIASLVFFNLVMLAAMFAAADIPLDLFLISMLFAVLLTLSPLRKWAIETPEEKKEKEDIIENE